MAEANADSVTRPTIPDSGLSPDSGGAAATKVRTGGAAAVIKFTAMGLLTGLAAAALLNSFATYVAVVEPAELAGTQGIWSAEQREMVRKLQLVVDYKNSGLALGLTGLVVAAGAGLAMGLTRRSGKLMATGAVVGAVAGIAAGAVGGLAAVLIREQVDPGRLLTPTGEPNAFLVQLHTMALQLPPWIAIAAAAALAARLASGNRSSAFLPLFGAGVGGAVLVALLFPTVASILFPTEHPNLVIPTGTGNRFLWVTGTATLMMFLMGRQVPAAEPTEPPPA